MMISSPSFNKIVTQNILTAFYAMSLEPFSTQEPFQIGDKKQDYKLNMIFSKRIKVDQRGSNNLQDPICSIPSLGKSFVAKCEIVNTPIDDVIIYDPDGEYFPLCELFKGRSCVFLRLLTTEPMDLI